MEDKKLQEALNTIIEIFSKNTKEEIVSISSIQFLVKGNPEKIGEKTNQKSFAITGGQPKAPLMQMNCVIIGDQIFCS